LPAKQCYEQWNAFNALSSQRGASAWLVATVGRGAAASAAVSWLQPATADDMFCTLRAEQQLSEAGSRQQCSPLEDHFISSSN
jgi:hypothetical protein